MQGVGVTAPTSLALARRLLYVFVVLPPCTVKYTRVGAGTCVFPLFPLYRSGV